MIDLYCIPYAGGTAKVIYNGWQKHLPPTIRVVPLELAGHGHRITEPFHASVQAVVADMLSQIKARGGGSEYAIYGHSMGSLVAYELCRALDAEGLPTPATLFVSGRRPPHRCPRSRNIHLLSDAALLREMEKLGGTPKEFFEDPNLIKAFLPIFRSDYRLLERYHFEPPIQSVAADIVFLYSESDSVVAGADKREWAEYTSSAFSVKSFPGGHFFINEQRVAICDLIVETLEASSCEVF
jgi:medium-chain acyl-[acyl-carrier-protein] hydrolase